ncbi:hypothetical protein DIPPA_09824 [Diplonema papillatum]|nr:hypothetical protein DIPPA_09824 [Diplonema papillatum]
MPTCAHCSRLADLRSRRAKLCYRKGHHRGRGERRRINDEEEEGGAGGPAPAPRQAKRENAVVVLPEAAEGERGPATSTSTSAAKVGKTAPTPAKKRQSDSAAEPVTKRRKGSIDVQSKAARPSPKHREEAEIDAQPMNLDEQSKKKRSTKRAPERDDEDELKRRKHDTSPTKR